MARMLEKWNDICVYVVRRLLLWLLFGAGENGLSGSKFFRQSYINFL